MTITTKAQCELFATLNEGDVFEYGAPFAFDAEKLVWRCEEVLSIATEDGPLQRYTFHVYFRDVMLRALVALVDPASHKIFWVPHAG
jgi:hypothetical protein